MRDSGGNCRGRLRSFSIDRDRAGRPCGVGIGVPQLVGEVSIASASVQPLAQSAYFSNRSEILGKTGQKPRRPLRPKPN